jgi:hypothetical protein
MKTRFASGSMVRFLSCSQTCGSQSHMFVNKDVQFRPAGGDMSFQVRDRVTPVIYGYRIGLTILRYALEQRGDNAGRSSV